MFYVIIKHVWPLESFWPPRWYVLSSDAFKRQIDLQLQLYYLILKKICGTGEVHLTVNSHKIRTNVRTKLNFSFCALKIMQFSDCVIENCFAVAISRVMGEWVWEMGGTWLFLFFDFFLATLERNHSYCLLKVYKLIVYINNY